MEHLQSKNKRTLCSLLGFPRDGTSRWTNQDKPGRDVPLSLCPFVPGQNKILVLVTLCPRRQEHMCRDKLLFKKWPDFLFLDIIFLFRTSFSCFRTFFSVLEHHFPVLECPFLLCPVCPGSRPGFWLSCPVPSRISAVQARPVPWQDF